MSVNENANAEYMQLQFIECKHPDYDGLPESSAYNAEGDYWVAFNEDRSSSKAHPAYSDALCAKLMATRGINTLLGGWDTWLERRDAYTDVQYFSFGHSNAPGEFHKAATKARLGISSQAPSWGTLYEATDVSKVVQDLEAVTGYKVHRDAVDLYSRVISGDPSRNTRGDFGYHDAKGAILTLAKLHGLVVTRFAVPIGLGFRNGDPMVILAEPNCRDGHRVDSFKTKEMRVAKWLQAYAGNSVDLRKHVEDLKVLNIPASTYLCKDQEEWHKAYNAGVSSCMSGFAYARSPVRAYATASHGLADNGLRLFIQYTGSLFGDNFTVQARAIVHEPTKCYVRAYGSTADAILRAHGYTEDSECLDGCTLAHIPHPHNEDCVLMPYIDGNVDNVELCSTPAGSEYFTIKHSGEFAALDPDGYISLSGKTVTCSCCGSRVYGEDTYSTAEDGDVCEECADSEYVVPYARTGRYSVHDCVHSTYHNDWVLEIDAGECAIEGPVSERTEYLVEAQGHVVLQEHTFEHPEYGCSLTLSAAEHLGEDFRGYEEDTEEAA